MRSEDTLDGDGTEREGGGVPYGDGWVEVGGAWNGVGVRFGEVME